jgi:lambda repressor-like predicted transcriptional regulator
MDPTTSNLVSKTVSTKNLIYTAFTTLPTELQLEILDYVPRKVVFQPKELALLKHFYIYSFCYHLGDESWLRDDHIHYTSHVSSYQRFTTFFSQNGDEDDEDDEDDFYLHYSKPEDDSCIDSFFELIPDDLRKSRPFMNKLTRKSPKAEEYMIGPMTYQECYSMVFTKKQFDYYRKFAVHTVELIIGYSFENVFDELKREREFILAFLNKHNLDMRSYASDELRDDPKFMLAVIHDDLYKVEYASDRLKKNRKFMLSVVETYGYWSVKYVSRDFRDDPEFMLAAIQHDIDILHFASDRLKKNRKFMLSVVDKYGSRSLTYASQDLGDDPEFMLAAIQHDTECCDYVSISDKLGDDPTFMLTVMQISVILLQDASKNLRKNREFMLAAVQQDGMALEFASKKLKNDREIVFAALQNDGWAFIYVSDELQNDHELIPHIEKLTKDREIVLATMKERSWLLEYASDEFKKDREIVLTAVQQNRWLLGSTSDELKKDREIVLAAVQQNGWLLEYASDELKKDREIVLAAVQQNGNSLRYASDELKKDREIVLAAVQQNGNSLRYASDELKKDREIVLADRMFYGSTSDDLIKFEYYIQSQ